MLQKIASKFQTTFLVMMVALLSLVFLLQFGGPQSQGCTEGGSSYAVRVYGKSVSDGEFRGVYSLAGFQNVAGERQQALDLKGVVIRGIIDRELLAREARDVGLFVSQQEVVDQLADDATAHLTLSEDAPSGVWSSLNRAGRPNLVDFAVTFRTSLKDENGSFDHQQAERVIQNGLRRSVNEFLESQVEEFLAERMREIVRSSVTVSAGEVWDAFERERDRANISYVKLSPAFFRDQLDPSDAELRAWMAENTEDVGREYQANLHRYTNLEPQVRASHILIGAAASASEVERADARARAEALLTRVRAGADFAALAREESDDSSAAAGGDLGYNARGRMVAPFDEAQFALEVGQVSEIVETNFGFHLIKLTGKREGDVPEAEAKLELTERLYREARSSELASEAANQVLARLSAGEDFEAIVAEYTPSAPEGEEAPATSPFAPTHEQTGYFNRTQNPISGADSGNLVRAAFDLSLASPLPSEPMRLGRDYVVYRLDERSEPNREDFTDEIRAQLEQGLLGLKQNEAVERHVARLREEAEAAGQIRINPSVVGYSETTDPS